MMGRKRKQAGLVNGFDGRQSVIALGLQGEVDHHDGVLLHDAYEQQDADQRHDAEIGSGDEQREDGADSGGWQRGENRERMDQAFVEDAENDVDGDERGEDEIGLVLEGILEGLRGALEGGVDGGGHAHVGLRFLEGRDGVAEGNVGGEIEGERNGRILALVIDGKRSALLVPVGDGGERNHCAVARGSRSGWRGWCSGKSTSG